MMRRKRRIDRKLHRWFLELGVIDASVESGWRRRLFQAPLHELFPIDSKHTEGLPAIVTRGVKRYGLSYVVCRVSKSETTFSEPEWDGFFFFRFQASKYPEIVSYTANNPEFVGNALQSRTCDT